MRTDMVWFYNTVWSIYRRTRFFISSLLRHPGRTLHTLTSFYCLPTSSWLFFYNSKPLKCFIPHIPQQYANEDCSVIAAISSHFLTALSLSFPPPSRSSSLIKTTKIPTRICLCGASTIWVTARCCYYGNNSVRINALIWPLFVFPYI